MSLDRLPKVLPLLLCGSVAAIGLSVPISTALDNFLLAVLLLGSAFNTTAVRRVLLTNPVARAAWFLFGGLLLAVCYGATQMREALDVLGKYVDLAFVPLFMVLFASAGTRRWAERAFMVAMGITLLFSYLLGLQVIGAQSWMSGMGSSANPVIFHSHITQNNMMAFAAFLAVLKCRDALNVKLRMAWAVFALLAAGNVLFMVQGRTGYLILLLLLCWFVWTSLARNAVQRGVNWGWRQGLIVGAASVLLMASAYLVSPRLHDRISLVAAEVHAWQPNQQDLSSSSGTRLNFYYNATQIVADHPIFGVGTGGFEAAFSEQTKGTNLATTPNPHNEFLLISAQLGLPGLLLLCYLFATLWQHAPRLDTPFAQDAARGLVLAYVVNCALNSALHDHADGLFFAWMAALLFSTLRHRQHE